MPRREQSIADIRRVSEATSPTAGAQKRLQRLHRLAWLLDRSIPIGKWRIGIDPLLGLIPGAGDWIGAVLSLYVIYEGARLGLSGRILTKMASNVLVETIVGAVPLIGDLFDFAWQANTRNLELIERHYQADLKPRSLRKLWVALVILAVLVATVIATLGVIVFKLLVSAFA